MASTFKYCHSSFDNLLYSRLPVQNLRSLDASRPKGLPGGFRTENDWKQEVRRRVLPSAVGELDV